MQKILYTHLHISLSQVTINWGWPLFWAALASLAFAFFLAPFLFGEEEESGYGYAYSGADTQSSYGDSYSDFASSRAVSA